MLKLCIFVLAAVTLGETQEKGNLDALIGDVFNNPGRVDNVPNEKPCQGGAGECVPYYLVRLFCSFLKLAHRLQFQFLHFDFCKHFLPVCSVLMEKSILMVPICSTSVLEKEKNVLITLNNAVLLIN